MPVTNAQLQRNGLTINSSLLTAFYGEVITLTCNVSPSRPAPTIAWYIGSELKQRSASTTYTFTFSEFDQHKTIYCKAYNLQLPSQGVVSAKPMLYVNGKAYKIHNWAMTWDFQQCGMCDQQSFRSACAYAQSDHSICLSLEYAMSVNLLTKRHLEFLSEKGGCTGSPESTLVKMPHCWKSHVTAQFSNEMTKPTKWVKTQISLDICQVWTVFTVHSVGPKPRAFFIQTATTLARLRLCRCCSECSRAHIHPRGSTMCQSTWCYRSVALTWVLIISKGVGMQVLWHFISQLWNYLLMIYYCQNIKWRSLSRCSAVFRWLDKSRYFFHISKG